MINLFNKSNIEISYLSEDSKKRINKPKSSFDEIEQPNHSKIQKITEEHRINCLSPVPTCPPTPKKARRTTNLIPAQNPMRLNFGNQFFIIDRTPTRGFSLNKDADLFEDLHRSLSNGEFKFSGQTYKVCAKKDARGAYMQAYEVTDEKELIKGYSNDQILIKAFHKSRIDSSPAELKKFMQSALNQYDFFKKENINVAKIHNYSTAKQDLCYVVEKIDREINWKNFEFDASYLDENKSHNDEEKYLAHQILKQLKNIFDFVVKNEKQIDIHPANVRYKLVELHNQLNENIDINQMDPSLSSIEKKRYPKIYLTDFLEELDKEDVVVDFIGSLKSWVIFNETLNEEIFDYLTKDYNQLNGDFANKFFDSWSLIMKDNILSFIVDMDHLYPR